MMGWGCRTTDLAAGKFCTVFLEPVLVTDLCRVLGKVISSPHISP